MGFQLIILMKFLTQITETTLSHLPKSTFHRIVLFPPEIFVVQCIVSIQLVRPTVHYGNDVAAYDVEEFFRYIIGADGILK